MSFVCFVVLYRRNVIEVGQDNVSYTTRESFLITALGSVLWPGIAFSHILLCNIMKAVCLMTRDMHRLAFLEINIVDW